MLLMCAGPRFLSFEEEGHRHRPQGGARDPAGGLAIAALLQHDIRAPLP